MTRQHTALNYCSLTKRELEKLGWGEFKYNVLPKNIAELKFQNFYRSGNFCTTYTLECNKDLPLLLERYAVLSQILELFIVLISVNFRLKNNGGNVLCEHVDSITAVSHAPCDISISVCIHFYYFVILSILAFCFLVFDIYGVHHVTLFVI